MNADEESFSNAEDGTGAAENVGSSGNESAPVNTNHWELYPCQLNGKLAWVAYDHGIKDTIGQELSTRLLRIRFAVRFPDADGHPHPNEFDDLQRVEDELNQSLGDYKTRLVGRVTVDSVRHLFYYGDASESIVVDLVGTVGRATGYRLECACEADPEHSQYWNELFPNFEDWQAIRDRQAITDLLRAGVDTTISRRLLHLATFVSRPKADEFAEWLQLEGYLVNGVVESPDKTGQFNVAFHNHCIPQLLTLLEYTRPLQRRAHALGGEYLGWQTTGQADQS